jgi:formylmethanofuran--tetrahydromethanopterin N-formyltransferase
MKSIFSEQDVLYLIHGVAIHDTFAEAFDMHMTRVIVTADDEYWLREAVTAMCGFGTSVIACGIEIAVERYLGIDETPDGRLGAAILALSTSGSELEKQIPRRAGQCILTCPTTALYAGISGRRSEFPKRVSLGKSLRYFGDGHQISKRVDGRRFWRIPVMDGEFVCDHDVARAKGIGGGNFLLLGTTLRAVSIACRAAVEAMAPLAGMITPFPGGATRSGSKVGSKYRTLFASTNEAYCPTLRDLGQTQIPEGVTTALEVVIDGVDFDAIARAMNVGIRAACHSPHQGGLLGVTAGNYGGKLGRHHFRLAEVLG